MARRYRYAFAKKKESRKGMLSVAFAVSSLLIFIGAIILSMYIDPNLKIITGGMSLFALLLSVYGFFVGLSGFSEENRVQRTSMVGSIGNGVIMVGWICIFLTGV